MIINTSALSQPRSPQKLALNESIQSGSAANQNFLLTEQSL